MSLSTPSTQPGACYRFTVDSAEEAVRVIRDQLGPRAKVLSVRQVSAGGLGKLIGRTKLEVVAQIDEPASVRAEPPAPAPLAASSSPAREVSAPRGGPSPRLTLPDLLRRSGISESALGRLQAGTDWPAREGRSLSQQLLEVSHQIRRVIEAAPRRALPSRLAFLGTAGSGRTTALCKWLGAEVFQRGRSGVVVKAEFDRPNPAENLAVFCEALGLTLHHFPGDWPSPGTDGFLAVDLPGLSLDRPAANQPLRQFLDERGIDGRILVLHAAYDLSVLRRAYSIGRDMGATHLVLTHADEISHWGKLWDFLLEGELQPLFLGTGPSLTGDCDEEVISAVLAKTLAARASE